MTPPLLLFGGTFDPPHRRHVELAEAASRLIGATEVRFVPVRVNPQRSAAPPAPAEDRLAMVRLAVEGHAGMTVSDLELRRDGPSYTVDTLRELRRSGETRAIRLLIGSDQALNLRSWREPEALLEMATPAVVLRPPHTRASYERDAAVQNDPRLLAWLLPVPPVDASSTDARRRLAAGEALDDLLAPQVLAYIRDRGLYGAGRA